MIWTSFILANLHFQDFHNHIYHWQHLKWTCKLKRSLVQPETIFTTFTVVHQCTRKPKGADSHGDATRLPCHEGGHLSFDLRITIPQKPSLFANADDDSSVLGSYRSVTLKQEKPTSPETGFPLPAPLFLSTGLSFFGI